MSNSQNNNYCTVCQKQFQKPSALAAHNKSKAHIFNASQPAKPVIRKY